VASSQINRSPDRVDAALARFDLRAGAAAVWSVVEEGNRTLTRERPWELSADDQRRHDVLATLVHTSRTVATEIGQFCLMLPHDDGSGRRCRPHSPARPRYSLASPQADARAAESTCVGVASSRARDCRPRFGGRSTGHVRGARPRLGAPTATALQPSCSGHDQHAENAVTHPTGHYANLTLQVEALPFSVEAEHAKVRRDGYRR
jgi:hypothetical protein